MKQSIQIRMGQSLTMTPQLQQAIKLLQLSTVDLQMEIQQALDSNPMLEAADDENNEIESAQQSEPDNEQELGGSLADIPDELPVDSTWEDVYEMPSLSSSAASSSEGPNFENQSGANETLREHLLWQMGLTPFTARDLIIAEAIIDAIDDQGYLRVSLDDIHEAVQADMDDEQDELEIDEIEAVLHRIHNFDPLGVGARDLRECLLVQLQYMDGQTPWLAQAKQMLSEHMDLLGAKDYPQLMRRMKLSDAQLREVMTLVQTLNPRPGSLIAAKSTEYIIPDVSVRKINGAWKVELNNEVMPRLRINSGYAGLVRRADNSADNTYFKNQLQEARWFLKSLQSRNETLLKVASCIVEHQRDFLEHGEEAMKALVLHDVAAAVEMHESTISRVTTQKYMHTPRGVFELKYFFSSHVGTSSGGECSATAIRALIKKLIAEEDPRKPLSDSRLAQILGHQGINVARRTIAKYRESISISSSSERKRLI